MNVAVWLYWFPLALGAGVVAALLGRPRAYVVAALAAAYWTVLALDRDPDGAANGVAGGLGILLGTVAMVAVGVWMAAPTSFLPARRRTEREDRTAGDDAAAPRLRLESIAGRFDEWLAAHRNMSDPWPDFGEFVRGMLQDACAAQRIRGYRLLVADDPQLYPLRRTSPDEHDFPSARTGIVGHVITSGKTYYAHDPAHGALVDALAATDQSENDVCAWCFAIRQDRRTIGVVQVGALDDAVPIDLAHLRLVESFVTLCWNVLTEACRSRLAGFTDPVAGVLTHQAFVEAGERGLAASYEHGEPVALVNVSVEGLRGLADGGQWDVANQIMFEVSSLLKQRIREEDEIGVFDGSRFLLLLRRVDSALARLIVGQLVERLNNLFARRDAWGHAVTARCGVAGSGVAQPTLRTLISRATAKCREARTEGVLIATDLPESAEVHAP